MKAENKGRFKLTDGYTVEFDQIARVLEYVCNNAGSRVPQNDIIDSLGFSEAHGQTFCRLAEAMGLIEPKTLMPTIFGEIVNRNDKFFDDIGTLWFMHYAIGSNPQNIVWNRFCNMFIQGARCFTIAQFKAQFEDLRPSFSVVFFSRFIHKEPRALLEAYIERNFLNLAFIRKDGEQYCLSYREDIFPLVLAACIARYRDKHRPGDTALAVTDLLTAPNSPGVVCQITEERLRAGLEALKTQPGLSLESRADLDQVRLTDTTPDYGWMERYYQSRH